MNIHIALVGKTIEPILAGIRLYSAIDKLYLLHSEGTKKQAQQIKAKLDTIGLIKRIFYNKINPFSMDSIVSTMTQIAREEHLNSIFVNITGGTNLMAGAATAASYFIGAQPYYVLHEAKLPKDHTSKDELVEIPVPNIPYHTSLEETQLRVLQIIATKGDETSNNIIRQHLNISPQTLSYNIKQLVKKKLITVSTNEVDARSKILKLSDAGKLVISWSKR